MKNLYDKSYTMMADTLGNPCRNGVKDLKLTLAKVLQN